MLFKTNIDTAFKVNAVRSPDMENAIRLWMNIAAGKPPWLREKEFIRTISFSNTMARELAGLVTQNIDIKMDAAYAGGNVPFLQAAIDSSFLEKAQDIMEKVIRYGGIMAKWNGTGVEYLTPDRFAVTEADGDGHITAATFYSYYAEGKKYYTRAEWHRFDGTTEEGQSIYKISNKAFISDTADTLGTEIALSRTKWKDIQPEARIDGLDSPLFVYLKNQYSNVIDPDSPLGVSSFAECTEELRWLDIAMSTLGVETEQSKPAMFVDEDTIMFAKNAGIEIPDFIMGLRRGVKAENTVQQWTPALQTQARIDGINFYLSILSYKAGFDPGYFVFNGQSISIATATQVEATERRTVNTVLSYRNLLDRPNSNGDGRTGFIHEIVHIIDTMAVMSGTTSPGDYGNYELYCDFADITANEQEDKMFDYQLANAGYMSKARFLVRRLGLTEDEALAMVAEAAAEQKELNRSKGGLFDDE